MLVLLASFFVLSCSLFAVFVCVLQLRWLHLTLAFSSFMMSCSWFAVFAYVFLVAILVLDFEYFFFDDKLFFVL